MTEPAPLSVVGRYVLHAPIARGGMATIYLARLVGAEGFSRMVAAKRLHPQFTEDAEFLRMFLDEARVASKVRHPNVVPMLDVVQMGEEVILVQEYVHGISLDKLLRAANLQKELLPVDIAVAIVSGMLSGLYAVHEAKDELGAPLDIVHRDVSPANVLVGVDGTPRLLDFGVAKATVNMNVTRTGVFKGKVVYASPEQLRGTVTHATDIYASAVALWEALAGERPYAGLSEAELIAAVSFGDAKKLTGAIAKETVSPERWKLLERLEPVVSKGMAFAAADRYATAAEMQEALLAAAPAATTAEVGRCVRLLGEKYLEARENLIASEESAWRQRATATPAAVEEPTDRPPASQPGTIARTLRASVLPAKQERRRVEWVIVAALLLIGVVLVGILILLLRQSEPIAVATAPAATAAPPAPVEPTASAAPTQEPTAAPTTSAAASADVEDSPVASAQATASARVSRRGPAAPRSVAPRGGVTAAPRVVAPPSGAAAQDCKTPFYFEGKKKIFKPGCL